MTIPPALTSAEWTAGEGRPSIERGEEYQGDGISAHVDEWLGFCVDNFTPETQSSHRDPASLAAIIALANAALPDGDPRKITWAMVDALREAAEPSEGYDSDGDTINIETPRADALLRLADILASYLPQGAP